MHIKRLMTFVSPCVIQDNIHPHRMEGFDGWDGWESQLSDQRIDLGHFVCPSHHFSRYAVLMEIREHHQASYLFYFVLSIAASRLMPNNAQRRDIPTPNMSLVLFIFSWRAYLARLRAWIYLDKYFLYLFVSSSFQWRVWRFKPWGKARPPFLVYPGLRRHYLITGGYIGTSLGVDGLSVQPMVDDFHGFSAMLPCVKKPGAPGGFDENLQSSGDLDVRASGHGWSWAPLGWCKLYNGPLLLVAGMVFLKYVFTRAITALL